jgi:hypothetical protein
MCRLLSTPDPMGTSHISKSIQERLSERSIRNQSCVVKQLSSKPQIINSPGRLTKQETVIGTPNRLEYQLLLVKKQSDNRKKAQESNKVLAKYLLTARTVEEKDAMPPTNDRRVEGLKGPWCMR